MSDKKKFIGVLRFDTITTLKEAQQILHDILKRNCEIEVELEPQNEGKIFPKDCNIQYIITKRMGNWEKIRKEDE